MPPRYILMLELLDAIEINDIKTVKTMLLRNPELSKGERSPKSPLWTAAVLGLPEIVDLLIKLGKLDVNEKKYLDEFTLLHWMGTKLTLCNENHFKVFHVLIRHGAEVNAKDCEGKTPLQYALQEDNTEWADFLLKNGAKKSEVEWVPDSPDFDIFVESDGSCTHKLKILFKRGLDPKYLDKKGNNLINIYLANINNCNRKNIVEIVKVLKDSGVSINEANKDGQTQLHYAVHVTDLQLISYLINEGADVRKKNKLGDTRLLRAVKKNSREVIKLFLSHGVDTEDKTAALHLACTNNFEEVIWWLLQHDADVRCKLNGKTPFFKLLCQVPNEKTDKAIAVMVREFAKLTFENISIDKGDMNAIQSDPIFQEYFYNCFMELNDAANFRCYGLLSYFMVLQMSKDIKKLAMLVQYVNFILAFNAGLNRFSFYQNDLIKIFEEAVKLRDKM